MTWRFILVAVMDGWMDGSCTRSVGVESGHATPKSSAERGEKINKNKLRQENLQDKKKEQPHKR